jgi:antitoxin MazE
MGAGYTSVDRISTEAAMRVTKWGDSLAILIPATVAEALELKEGADIEIRIADRREMEVSRKPSRDELLKRLRAFRGRLPADFKFDREEEAFERPNDFTFRAVESK